MKCNVAYEVRNNTKDQREQSIYVVACKYKVLDHTLLSDWSQLFGTTCFEIANSILAGGLVAKSTMRP
jgi:hypothetical protein